MATATPNPLDIEAGASSEQDQSSSQRLADISIVQSQLRFLAWLHKPDGSGLSALAYVGYALLLVSWYVGPQIWFALAADGSPNVCGEGRIELDGTGAVELMRDDGALCHGGNHSFSYASSGIVHASSVCEAVGSRLCRLEEVMGGDVAGQAGCEDPDTPVFYTWTSSTANEQGVECPVGQHMTVATQHPFVGANNPPRCAPDTDDLQVFCCADARVNSRTTCPTMQASGDTSAWPKRCTSAKSCSELAGQWPEGVWRLTADRNTQAWGTMFAFMYCPMALAIWYALCHIGKPGCGELHALLGGVERLSDGEVAAILWWRNLALGVTTPLSGLLVIGGLTFLVSVPDVVNTSFQFAFVWFCVAFMPLSVLAGALWILTLKTASVTGCHAVGDTEDLVASWVERLPRKKQLPPGAQDDLSTHADDLIEQTAQCVDEIGTAIFELNMERVPRLGEGWGLSITFGMLGSVGFFIMVLPSMIRKLTGAEQTDAAGIGVDALLVTFFGVLPLVLLSLPASVTDRCIALETRLSDLLIPNDPNSMSKKGRYVVSYETSQQLHILEKYMQQQNNKQGMGFVIFGQLCSRRFSWQFFVFAAAVLTTGVGMLYEAIGVL